MNKKRTGWKWARFGHKELKLLQNCKLGGTQCKQHDQGKSDRTQRNISELCHTFTEGVLKKNCTSPTSLPFGWVRTNFF